MLLAAGLGSRLGELTSDLPKPMIRVGGRPVLEWNIERLRHAGFRSFVINLHHRPDVVRSFFGDGSRLGVEIAYSFEPTLLGTSGAVRAARRLLTPDVLVIYGDNLVECDYARFLESHTRHQAAVTVGLWWREDTASSGVAVLDPDDRIREFIEKPAQRSESHWVNAGVLMCASRVLDLIPDGASDFGRDVIPASLRAGQRVQGHRFGDHESLLWIDTPADLRRTEAVLRAGSEVPASYRQ